MFEVDIEKAISELTSQEKISLTSGHDFWHTTPIPRLNIPSIRLSDGPNGVRGTRFFNGIPAACLPCATALGATWDTSLAEELGHLLGTEARAKGAHVLLGPTVNIQRSPLGGRGFESFSEDGLLSGQLAGHLVRGLQSEGVGATLKHFVCNDQEHERFAVDTLVTPRALREIYLLPFQQALRICPDVRCFMTAYNRVNGLHVSENKALLEGILREEWGFKGLLMSDWFGTYSSSDAINAGLDLEMPGPTRWRGDVLAHAINSRKVADHVLDERVRNVLKLVNYAGKSGIPEGAEEKVLNTEEDRALLRRAAAQSIVLLKNENSILPLDKNKPITVIGPNSKFPAYCGGGSASLLPYYTVTPFDAVSEASTAGVTFSQGVYAHQDLPLLGPLMKNPDGKQGFRFIVYNDPPGHKDRTPIDTLDLIYSSGFLPDYVNSKIKSPEFYVDMVGTYTPEEDGLYDFGVTVSGTAQLFIDGELVVDNTKNQTAGSSFFGAGTIEERGSKELKAGTPHQVVFQFGSYKTSKLSAGGNAVFGYGGFKFGGCRRIDHGESIAQAVAAAKTTDQVVLFAGLNGEWESEGYDRANMDLPPGSDELIARVVEANPNTVVVIQSGTPVTMPWASKTNALLQAWFGGNETGHGISDVLFGDVNPSGKLPLTFPVRLQDNPSYVNFGSARGRVLYGEDVYVGYRYYEKVQLAPQFAFGHGLSYTTFSRSNLKVTVDDGNITASLHVKNEGLIAGAEVVQLWVLPSTGSSIARPVRELKGFKKVELNAGEEKAVEIVVPKKVATSFWDEIRDSWASEKGEYLVQITGTGDSQLEASFQIDETVYWKGL